VISNAYGPRGTVNQLVDTGSRGLQLKRLTAVALPVTVDEAKAFMRVNHNDDNAYITTLIRAMTWRIEDRAEIALSTQSIQCEWSYVYDRIIIPRPPFVSVTTVTKYDENGVATPFTAGQYVVTGLTTIELRFKSILGERVRIEYVAGYGNSASIPDDLKQYILQLVFTEYKERGSVTQDMIDFVAENFKSFFVV
jgi:uncharacterized phiE125 gp8 family phage protein